MGTCDRGGEARITRYKVRLHQATDRGIWVSQPGTRIEWIPLSRIGECSPRDAEGCVTITLPEKEGESYGFA